MTVKFPGTELSPEVLEEGGIACLDRLQLPGQKAQAVEFAIASREVTEIMEFQY